MRNRTPTLIDGLLPCTVFSGTKGSQLELEPRSFSALLPLFISGGTSQIYGGNVVTDPERTLI
jgi:hypothetical protein